MIVLHVLSSLTAWIRRANIAKTRPRFRRRSTSPEGTSLKTASSVARASRETRPVSPPSSQVVIPALDEDMSIDLGRAEEGTHQDGHFDPYGMTKSLEDDDGHHSLINTNQDERPGVFNSTSASDSDMSSSALGLMLHDETASTARRFSRAFADDIEEEGDNDDVVQNRMNTLSGPFMASSAKSHTERDHDRHDERSSLDTHLGLLSPSPIHPSYSTTATSPFMDTIYSYSGYSPEGGKGEMTLQDVDRHRDEDLRPISPLRARMEKKTSTATPPSFSANLDSTEHTTEEASIIPFWFDQDNIAFDNDEGHDEGDDSTRYTSQYNEDADKGSHHDQHNFHVNMPEHDQASPSLSPSDRREMASYTSSKGEDQKVANNWSGEHSVRSISA